MLRRLLCVALILSAGLASAQSMDRSTPPRLIETFLSAVMGGRYQEAAEAMDLNDLTERTPAKIEQAASDLAFLLEAFEAEGIQFSDEPDQSRLLISEVSGNDGRPIGRIEIVREEQLWKFASNTVAKAPAMAEVIRLQEQIAQPSPSDPSVQTSGGSGEEGASSVPEYLASPRATMETYLTAMNEGNLPRAIETLNLSYLGAGELPIEAPQVANRLFAILNRTEIIVLDTIPSSRSGPPYQVAEYRSQSGRLIGRIRLEQAGDGAWKFTSDSLQSLPEIWEFVKDRDVLAGLKDVSQHDFDPASWVKERVPESWHRMVMGLELWQWLGLFLSIVVSALCGTIVRVIARWLIRLKLKLDKQIASQKVLSRMGRALSILAGLAVFRWVLPYLGLPANLIDPLVIILGLVHAASLVWLLWTAWDVVCHVISERASERSRRAETLFLPIIEKLGQFVILIGVLIAIASQFGVNVTGLIAGLGVGGAILALAAKDSVENILGSITILFEAPFGIGDWVTIGEVDGDVEEIGLRSTRIRTFKDSVIVVPNRTMITEPIENYGRRRYRRLKTTLGLEYGTPPAKVEEFCQAVRDMLLAREDIWNGKCFVFFNDFGASTLDILLYVFIISPNWEEELRIRGEVLNEIMQVAAKVGVEFAFPTRKLSFDNDSLEALRHFEDRSEK